MSSERDREKTERQSERKCMEQSVLFLRDEQLLGRRCRESRETVRETIWCPIARTNEKEKEREGGRKKDRARERERHSVRLWFKQALALRLGKPTDSDPWDKRLVSYPSLSIFRSYRETLLFHPFILFPPSFLILLLWPVERAGTLWSA